MIRHSLCERKLAMIYKFSSKATGDLLMTDDVGARVLSILGKDATAQGIIEVNAMPAGLRALEAAVAEDDSRLAHVQGALSGGEAENADGDTVTLRQHVWPFVEMVQRAQAAGEVIVWGV